jgi:hypothetical protein
VQVYWVKKVFRFPLLFGTFLSAINRVLHSRCGEKVHMGEASFKQNVILRLYQILACFDKF